jgi:hypothetical protein
MFGRDQVFLRNQSNATKYSNYGTNTDFTKLDLDIKLLGYRVPNLPDRALIVPLIYVASGS